MWTKQMKGGDQNLKKDRKAAIEKRTDLAIWNAQYFTRQSSSKIKCSNAEEFYYGSYKKLNIFSYQILAIIY